MAAFLGAIAGAAIAGVPPVVSAVIQRGTARAQRQLEKDERDAQREEDRTTAEREAHKKRIAEWREGLAKSHASIGNGK
jgi:cell division protein FtsB